MKECVGSTNIYLHNHMAYTVGLALFKSTVCIVLCCNFGMYSGFCSGEKSYGFIHIMNPRFLHRHGFKVVYFSAHHLQLFKRGKMQSKALWKNVQMGKKMYYWLRLS